MSRIQTALLGFCLLLAGCNLQTLAPTPTPVESTAAADVTPTSLPSLTPLPDLTARPTLVPPPLAETPTAVPLGVSSGTPNPLAGEPTVDPATATQRYALTARAGKTVGVNYNLIVTRGTVTLIMQGPEGVVWKQTFSATETGRVEVPVQGGAYEILAQVERFDGSFDLSWD